MVDAPFVHRRPCLAAALGQFDRIRIIIGSRVRVETPAKVSGVMAVAEARNGAGSQERLATIFSALSDPTRMQMFTMILTDAEVACSLFDRVFPLSKSTISYHTKILNAAGLIETRRVGRFFYYRAIRDELDRELPGLADRLVAAG
jgi:DNA-binding transcriptional ArsR family regulator